MRPSWRRQWPAAVWRARTWRPPCYGQRSQMPKRPPPGCCALPRRQTCGPRWLTPTRLPRRHKLGLRALPVVPPLGCSELRMQQLQKRLLQVLAAKLRPRPGVSLSGQVTLPRQPGLRRTRCALPRFRSTSHERGRWRKEQFQRPSKLPTKASKVSVLAPKAWQRTCFEKARSKASGPEPLPVRRTAKCAAPSSVATPPSSARQRRRRR
mmetsp:Transcript_25486/g.96044  ORF Transcript_25486/g.96044 Transcript_25486/m.96044 type:complete len:209 (+) Transcript_25486:685-1311(+)